MDHIEEPPVARTRMPGVRGLAMRIAARVRPFVPVIRTVGFVVAVGIVIAMGVGAANDVHLDQMAWWPLPLGVLAAGIWWVLLGRGWVLLLSGRLNRGDTHRLIVIAHCVSLSGRPQRALYYDAKSRAKQCRGRSTIDICALFSYAAGAACFDQERT